MTKEKVIENAEAIIERFGGIRPMANKIDVPVTTVQGWKKRNVIPASRYDLIVQVANANNIDLMDLMDTAMAAIEPGEPEQKSAETASDIKIQPEEQKAEVIAFKKQEEKAEEIPSVRQDNKPQEFQEYKPSSVRTSSIAGLKTSEEIMAEIEASEKKAIRNSIWASCALLALVIAGGSILLWPQAKGVQDQITTQGEKIGALEENVATLGQDVRDVNMRAKFLDGVIPEDMEQKFKGLQNQAQNLENTFQQLSEKTQGIQQGVLGPDAGTLNDRLAVLELKVAEITGSQDFAGLVARVRGLEQSVAGQQQLGSAIDELRTIVDGIDGRVNTMEEGMEAAKSTDTALGQTIAGVPSTDLKAAAMLIAFSQLRDSLNREAPFEEDIILLQKMVGDDNPELKEALTRLAPHADGGVLSAEGLSEQLKGLAGDIAFSSLKGEDVSLADKAKARLNTIFQVEKDGEVITGTDTQARVAKAQKLLDQGDIQGAIFELQALEGPAAEQAQPFIEQAQVSLLAEQVQNMLRDNILSNITSSYPSAAGGTPIAPYGTNNGINLKSIQQNIQDALPAPGVVKDEESGLSILPQQKGFKGLIENQP